MVRSLSFVALILATLGFAEAPVVVEAYDEQANDRNQVTLRIRLTNHTADTLQNVRLRYFLDHEIGRDLALSPYYLPGATLSIDTLDFGLAVNINLPKLAPGVFPNDAGMSLGLHYSDYGPFDKEENFSYPGADSFVEAKRVAVYLEGVLFAGESPVDMDVPQIRISAFQPEKSNRGQWVKLKNVGDRSVDLKYVSVSDSLDRYTLGESIENRTFVPGDTLVVCVSSPCDGDGIMDYDEIDRFGTDPYKADSDGDGILDKTEIWSHTIRESVRWWAASDDSSQNPVDMLNGALIVGVEKELFSDSDGDGVRAELDIDSDGDGIRDGDEDLNRNGVVEEGETDPYIANGGGLPVHAEDDVPGDFALYSLGRLSLNDGSVCRYKKNANSSNSECALASESSADYYAVSLAGRSGEHSVVHSKGGVLVRNRDSVNTVNMYSDKEVKPTLNVQKGASVTGYAYLPEQNWVWSVNSNLEPIDVGNQDKIVRSGEVFLLLDGEKFRTLKVEAGGTLVVGAGEMYVGSLQLESGGKVDFAEHGYATILHVDETVIWRGNINLDGLRGDGILSRLYSIVCGFKLIYHGDETLFIEGDWAGTLFAPKAKLVLGQAKKSLYGRFVGNGITVHQYATLHAVPFAPKTKTAIAHFNMEEK